MAKRGSSDWKVGACIDAARRERVHCPSCSRPMVRSVENAVEVHSCARCKSAWLGTQAFLEFIGKPSYFTKTACLAGADASEHRCPECGERLRSIHDSSWLWITLEACPHGHGVHLDEHAYWRSTIARSSPHLLAQGQTLSLRARFEYYRRPFAHHPLGTAEWLYEAIFDLPSESNHPPLKQPVATFGLIVVNVVVFMLTAFDTNATALAYGLVPFELLSGERSWSLLSYQFLHLGGAHLVGNLYFLYKLGDNVEDILEWPAYLVMYLASGFAGGIVWSLAHPESMVPVIGASGAISGVIGAYLVGCPRAKVTMMVFFRQFRVSVFVFVGLWVMLQVGYAVTGMPGIAFIAHLAGFLFGVLAMLVIRWVALRERGAS